MNYREHFHCAVPMCKGKDFAKKEEMIRHSKWHQKMDEALKYGFRRVTPMDDCSDQFQVRDGLSCYSRTSSPSPAPLPYRPPAPPSPPSLQECSHNKKQTHYHCIQSEGCDKVQTVSHLIHVLIFTPLTRCTSAPRTCRCTSTTTGRTTPSSGRASSGSGGLRTATLHTASIEVRVSNLTVIILPQLDGISLVSIFSVALSSAP